MSTESIDAEIRAELDIVREWAADNSMNDIDRAVHFIEGMDLATRLRHGRMVNDET